MVDRGDSNSARLEANGNGNGFGNAENHTGSNRRDRHAQSQFNTERTETVRISLNATQKVFVCIDYTQGLDIRFLRDFPPSLSPFVSNFPQIVKMSTFADSRRNVGAHDHPNKFDIPDC